MPARQPLTLGPVHDLGEAVGKIAAFAAQSLHESFPHLDLDGLVATFTRDSALEMITRRYLAGLDHGKTPGEAAGEAGTALIRAWADARLAARAQLDQEQQTPARTDGPHWARRVICRCGTEVHDTGDARQGHHDQWHTDDYPAVYSAPLVIAARDIRHGDVIRGRYRPGVTVATAIVPGGEYHPGRERVAVPVARPYLARQSGLAALDELPDRHEFTEDSPVCVTREHATTTGR